MNQDILVILLIVSASILGFVFFFLVEYFYDTGSTSTASIPNHLQPVSIFITVYNGEKEIADRILYFLDPEEWIEGSELFVISPGSTDGTDEILQQFKNDLRVKIIIEKRLTKIRCLNKFVPLAKNEILILSDFRQKVHSHSVKNLIRHFQNPDIAAVSSTLIDGNSAEFSFRSILNKMAFNRLGKGSSLNVFGALYAQRKIYFTPFPEELLFDDLFVVANTLKQKKRLIQDPDSVIEDVAFQDYYQKERIERLVRGLLIFLSTQKRLIFTLPLKQYVRFLFYKYFKLLLPVLSLFLIFCVALLLSPIQLVLIFTPAVILGSIFPKISFLFIRINYYFLSATFKFLVLNRRSNKWEPLKNSMR